MKSLKQVILLTLSITAVSHAQEVPKSVFSCCAVDPEHIARPDEYGPISVMGTHTHAKGSFMASYRYMFMDMDGMRYGNDRVSSSDVFADSYAVTPESMTMDMHMLGFMYGLTDELTLTLMGSYIESQMEHRLVSQTVANGINSGAREFTTSVSGISDLRIGGLYRFYAAETRMAHFGLGLSLPTGSIDEKDTTPGPGGAVTRQLPAAMQLGSGTFDLLPSITFVQQIEDWTLGLQSHAVIRLENSNNNNYRHGNILGSTAWAGYRLNDWLGLTTGLAYTHTGKLRGTQEDVGVTSPVGRTVTTAYSGNYGGERLDTILGINTVVPKGPLKNHRVSADVRLPLWQDLNGYQLETDLQLTVGWQASF